MYDLRFVSNNGRELRLNYENGIIVSRVDGVTGMIVTTKTAQGYQQVGVSISSLTVGGRDLTVNGFIFRENAQKKQEMLDVFAPFVTGRLYWEERYWIDVAVKNAPTISQNKDSTFTFRLFAADPYFRASEKITAQNGEITGLFWFPVTYTGTTIGENRDHKFGEKEGATEFNIINRGQASAPYDLTITGSSSIVNPKLTNSMTGEFVKVNDTISVGETIRIYSDQGRIRVLKRDIGGVEHNAIASLDDESTLFSLAVGDNILRATADTGGNDIETNISFYPLYSGVLMNGV